MSINVKARAERAIDDRTSIPEVTIINVSIYNMLAIIVKASAIIHAINKYFI